jgi:hypothetical protein
MNNLSWGGRLRAAGRGSSPSTQTRTYVSVAEAIAVTHNGVTLCLPARSAKGVFQGWAWGGG